MGPDICHPQSRKRHRPLQRTTTRNAYTVVPPLITSNSQKANRNSLCLGPEATVGAYRASSRWISLYWLLRCTLPQLAVARKKLLIPFNASLFFTKITIGFAICQ